MNKILITEEQLFNLICEASTLDDIYVKYYSNIDREVFNQIVSSDPTWREEKPDKMGKFGKWLLKLWLNRKLKLEDLYKAKEYLTYFVKYNNRIEIKDINKYGSLQDLFSVVSMFMENPEMSTSHSDEIRRIKEGAEKVYEDKEWLVIVPHTQEASCYYGKGTQWCTAAEKSANMFDHYNEQGNLYININKVSGEKYQLHFESDSFMDATDTPIDPPIYDTLEFGYGILDFYKDILPSEQFTKLVETKIEVDANDNGEILYYCTTPYIDYWYLYDEVYGEVIADRLKKLDPEYITNALHGRSYVVISNLYGNYTLVSKSSNGYEKIGDNYISVDHVDNVFGTDLIGIGYNSAILCTVNKDGLMEIYNPEVGYNYYSIEMEHFSGKGSLRGDIIWIKKKNGLYDLIDVNYDNCLYNLRPIDESDSFRMDENEEYLYMYNGQNELWKICLFDGLEYEEVEDMEEY